MRTSRGPMPWVLLLTVVLLWKEVMCQDEASVVVKLKQGEIFAQRETTAAGKAFYSFRGIPYAQPPVNGLRFRDPIPPSAWYDPLDGSKAPSVCPQLDLDAVQQGEVVLKGNENCLYLNVYAPRPKQGKLPVIVWIHGGAFIAGGAEEYAPMALLDKDIVLVSIQYRLGTLGMKE
ncbi:Carboxylesterase 5A [Halocaridina rubra]|uniref:Carboxylesterase 5A n=1 Tax=Halocaridina rubra TaxID=373956 RepID=A0AAN8ZSR7_HALRR